MDETSHLKGLKFLIPDGSEIQQSELTARLNGEKKRLLSEHFVCRCIYNGYGLAFN
jgi:hypothetical protein